MHNDRHRFTWAIEANKLIISGCPDVKMAIKKHKVHHMSHLNQRKQSMNSWTKLRAVRQAYHAKEDMLCAGNQYTNNVKNSFYDAYLTEGC